MNTVRMETKKGRVMEIIMNKCDNSYFLSKTMLFCKNKNKKNKNKRGYLAC